MPFPFNAQGTIVADSIDVAGATSAVERMLRDVKASRIFVGEPQIDFTVRSFRLVTNWNLLVSIDSGRITFRPHDDGVELRYRISFIRMLIIVTAMVVAVFGFFPVMSWGPQSRVPLPMLLFAWCWLFGGNYVITVSRFPSALRSALRTAGATPTPNQAMQRTAPRSDAKFPDY